MTPNTDRAPMPDGSRDTRVTPLSAEERKAIMASLEGLNPSLANRYEATLVALEASLTARAVRAEEECTFLRTAIRDACLSLSAPAQDVGVRASRVAHHLQATLDSSPRPATP